MRIAMIVLVALLGACASPTEPARDTAMLSGQRWTVRLTHPTYWCGIAVEHVADSLTAIAICRRIRSGWVPPW